MELLIGRKSLTLTLAFEEQSSDNVASTVSTADPALTANLERCIEINMCGDDKLHVQRSIRNPRLLCLNLIRHSQNWRYGRRRRRWHHLTVKEPGELPGGADRCGHLLRHLDRTPPSLLVTDRRTFAPLSFFQNQNKCASTKHRSSPDQNKSMTPIES